MSCRIAAHGRDEENITIDGTGAIEMIDRRDADDRHLKSGNKLLTWERTQGWQGRHTKHREHILRDCHFAREQISSHHRCTDLLQAQCMQC